MIRTLAAMLFLLVLAGCAAYGPAPCHHGGEDYTGRDACS